MNGTWVCSKPWSKHVVGLDPRWDTSELHTSVKVGFEVKHRWILKLNCKCVNWWSFFKGVKFNSDHHPTGTVWQPQGWSDILTHNDTHLVSKKSETSTIVVSVVILTARDMKTPQLQDELLEASHHFSVFFWRAQGPLLSEVNHLVLGFQSFASDM